MSVQSSGGSPLNPPNMSHAPGPPARDLRLPPDTVASGSVALVDDPSFGDDVPATHSGKASAEAGGSSSSDSASSPSTAGTQLSELAIASALVMNEAAKEGGLVGEGLDARAIAEDGLRLVVAEELAQREVVGNAFGVDLPGRVARAASR